MTVRIHIDRLVIDRGLLEPGQLADFRTVLQAELAKRLAPAAPGPAHRVPAGPASTLGRQVAQAIGQRVPRS